MRSLLHSPRTRKRSIAAATLGALALLGSLLVPTPAQALNDTGTGGVFVPSTGRILDTKAGTGGFSTPMEAGKYRTIKVAGLAGLPDDGSVGAVSLNATVGGTSGYGTLIGRPDADSGRTTMLIYNGVSGEYTSNSATIAVGADGTIQVMTETASRLILDVQGYYTANTDGTAAGGFVPVAKRLVDTRSGTGAAKAAIAPGKSIDVQITGSNGVPAGASAAVVNLIAVNSTDADGYLAPYATGGTKPQNSLHYAPSETTSVQAQVPLSADGKLTIANLSTTTNLLVDLQGYFTAAGKGGAVFTPSYGRAYDSRASGNTALAKNETRSIQIAGTAGVPVMGSGITAVTLTLIVAHGGSAGYADVYADGKTDPGITAVNFQPNEIQTNTITVPLGANGKIALRNAAETTNYVVDVQGWYTNPIAPTISCPSPYSAGAWVKSIPAADINCTVGLPAAAGSNRTYTVTVDDDVVASGTQAVSAATVPVAVSAFGGTRTIVATIDGASTPLESSYQFTLGDWAHDSWTPNPPTTATVSPTPELSAIPDTVDFPDDASLAYTVLDSSGAAVATSGNVTGSWTVPAGTLTAGQTYSWRVVVTGSNEINTATETQQSDVWTFTTSSDVAGSEDTIVNTTDQQCVVDTKSSASAQGTTVSDEDATNACSYTTTTTITDENSSSDASSSPGVLRAASKIHDKGFLQSKHAWDWHWVEEHKGHLYWDGENAWVTKKNRGKTGWHQCHSGGSSAIQATITVDKCSEYGYGAGVAEAEAFSVQNYIGGVPVSSGSNGMSIGIHKDGSITYRQYYR